MQIAAANFIAGLFDGQVAVNTLFQRALRDVAGESAGDAAADIDWIAFSVRALALLDEGDEEARTARADAASGEFALADLFPPATESQRVDLGAEAVAGLKRLGRTLGVSLV